ncbi:MAG: hypothetical protein AMJ46_05005 [Latescibacteria bacterium DG_63]|nr:MAG: hypothetical protein AMJ46_05005 [Latescibacteria bacterium DG_63]
MKALVSGLAVGTAALLLVGPAYSQLQPSGYFEPQFTITVLDDEVLELNSNKVRVDLNSEISDGVTFTGNLNFIDYNGLTTWDLLDFLPDNLVARLPEHSLPQYSLNYQDEWKLDNAYLRLRSGVLMVTIGRQQMSVGSGYGWNPTDLFNAKDIMDPTYEQPGVNGVRVDIGLSDHHTLVTFYSPEGKWTESGKLIRLLGRLSHFDYALSAGQRRETRTDFTTFQANEPRQDVLGFDLNGELMGVGCWSENVFGYIEGDGHYWESITGADYTFSSGWYVMAEYYYNDAGKKQHDDYSLDDWMRYLTAETRTLGRSQFYSYTVYPLTDLLTVGGSFVYCTSDNSLLVIPTCAYSISGNVTLTFFGSIYSGREGAMYSRDMGKGGIVRLRAHF